jgi:sorting nexin-1/2
MKKFEVTVSAPEKVGEGIMSAHVEYKLNVKVMSCSIVFLKICT